MGAGNGAERQVMKLRQQRRAITQAAEPGYQAQVVRIPVLMDTQFGDVVRQFGATTAPTTSSNCG